MNIGDRIELFGEGLGGIIIGDTSQLSVIVAVEFDEKVEMGHSCGGQGKMGYCLWVHRDHLDLPSDNENIYEDALI